MDLVIIKSSKQMKKLILIAMLLVGPFGLFAQVVQNQKPVVTKSRLNMSSLDFKHKRFIDSHLKAGSQAISSIGRLKISSPVYKNRYQKIVLQAADKNQVIQKFNRMNSLDFKHNRFKK